MTTRSKYGATGGPSLCSTESRSLVPTAAPSAAAVVEGIATWTVPWAVGGDAGQEPARKVAFALRVSASSR